MTTSCVFDRCTVTLRFDPGGTITRFGRTSADPFTLAFDVGGRPVPVGNTVRCPGAAFGNDTPVTMSATDVALDGTAAKPFNVAVTSDSAPLSTRPYWFVEPAGARVSIRRTGASALNRRPVEL